MVDSLAATIREAVQNVGHDGRLNPVRTLGLRQRLRKIESGEDSALSQEADELFGPFEMLSQPAQRAVVKTIEEEERWRLYWDDLGKWHAGLSRVVFRTAWRHGGSVGRAASATVRGGPARVLVALRRLELTRQARFSSRPSLAAILHHAGIDVRSLAVCYARGLSQPTGYNRFWHDPARHTTAGLLLGLDLILGPGGYWHVECNLNSGLSRDRTAMYHRDPFVSNLLAFAESGGYRHLVVIAPNWQKVDELMAQQYEEESLARGIGLTILEDSHQPTSRHPQCHQIPTPQKDGTLIVCMRSYHTNLDYLLDHKRGSDRALRVYCARNSDCGFQLPKVTVDPDTIDYDSKDQFPNLVYKFPERDGGTGVFFFKATSPEHARILTQEAVRQTRPSDLTQRLYWLCDDHRGFYQRYIPGALLTGRRLYKVRAHVFLTPLGAHFLSAHRLVSKNSVPLELPPGIVRNSKPYLVNSVTGRREVLPADEEAPVAKAALAVARGLSWAASYGFQTTLNGHR